MRLIGIFALFLLWQFIACGTERKEDQDSGDQTLEAGHLRALVLSYEIRVDDIPLMEPQTEALELTISDYGVKYDGSVEITMAGEKKVARRASIFNFADSSLTLLNLQDSTYTLFFYNPATPESDLVDGQPDTNSGLSPGYRLKLTASTEQKQIGTYANCVRMDLVSSRSTGPGKSGQDSIPRLNGQLWIEPQYSSGPILNNYYRTLASYFSDPNFEGLEIWRVFSKLGIPGTALAGILKDVDGLIVSGEFTCQMFSLGKRANVSIKLELKDLSEKRIPLSAFKIPSEYKPALGRGR
jgi:hypothetical protein